MENYKDIWVYAEQRCGELMNVALELLGEGYRLSRERGDGCRVCAVVLGKDIAGLADELFAYGADVVYVAEDDLLENYTTGAYTKVFTGMIEEYKPETVLFGATYIGRDLAPRVAARLNTGLTADCTRLDIDVENYIHYLDTHTTLDTSKLAESAGDKNLKQTRPAFGGNLMATILCPETRPQMSTVRPGVMSKREKQAGAAGELVKVACSLSEADLGVKVLDVVKEVKELVNLTEADIICSGGRGLGGAEGFDIVKQLAGAVGGVVGASRAAVDAGWIEASRQVGQTGTTVKPKIYFALGISGAIQHLAGMQSSDIIIAVNKDPDAPIFEVADYSIVGDLYQVIPEIIEQWNTI